MINATVTRRLQRTCDRYRMSRSQRKGKSPVDIGLRGRPDDTGGWGLEKKLVHQKVIKLVCSANFKT